MAAMSEDKRGRGLPEQLPRPTSTTAAGMLRNADVIGFLKSQLHHTHEMLANMNLDIIKEALSELGF